MSILSLTVVVKVSRPCPQTTYTFWGKRRNKASKLGSIVLPAKHRILGQNWLSVLSSQEKKKYNKKYKTHNTGLSKVKKGVHCQNTSSSALSLSLTHTHLQDHLDWFIPCARKKTSHIHFDCYTSSSVSSFNIKVIIKKLTNKIKKQKGS